MMMESIPLACCLGWYVGTFTPSEILLMPLQGTAWQAALPKCYSTERFPNPQKFNGVGIIFEPYNHDP